jgi:hypothetical protein
MLSFWQGKLKVKIWLLEEWSLDNYREHHVSSPNLTQPTRLTPQKWMKEDKREYVSIVIVV